MSAGVRVVFDCVVFLQGVARARGPAGRCLDLLKGRTSNSSFVTRSFAKSATSSAGQGPCQNPEITDAAVDELFAHIRKVSHHVADPPLHVQIPRDPKDEVYLNLAIEAGARYLVTRDNDLLDLMRPDTADGRAFMAQFPALTILDPVAFLAAVRPAP